MYNIQLENGEVIARNLTDETLDAWWAASQDEYFGLRVEPENLIIVCRTSIPLRDDHD